MGEAKLELKQAIRNRAYSNLNDLIVGAVGLLAGILLWFVFIPETVVIRSEVHYFFRNPQFTPRLWTLFILFNSLMVIIEALFLTPTNEERLKKRINLSHIMQEFFLVSLLLLVMVGFVYLVPVLGYLPTVAICFVAALLCFGYYKITHVILLGAVVPPALYYFFVELLNVYIR